MNALAAETSPYLRQHANNPVDWLPWGEAAFEAARARQVPLFVSIGYSACHWCHVMERESFENEEIAAIINRHFVPVKVDREERPDVDAIYMAAVQAMTQQGGWPLTVFLTPDGEPFYGGTYYPPFDHFGRPGLARVLASVSEAWTARREQVMDSARDVADYLRGRFELEGQAEPGSGLGEKAVASLAQSFDAELGGFGGAPKFPNAPLLDFLLARAYRGDGRALEMAVRTLEAMAAGGMRDHLAGGFFRYSTDATWTVPHFEKMLYDNAQLALTYLRAGQLTGRDDLTGVAADTLRFLLSDLSGPSGEFHASLDADAAGREGATYLWTPAEVAGALGNEDEARRVSAALAVTASGDLDGGSVPRPKPPTVRRAGEVAPGVLDRLLAAREKRPQPARDGKVLTSWNSLAVSALARCGAATGDEALLDAAGRALAFLRERHWRDGRLLHHSTGGVDGTAGFLDDYALFGEALLDWHAVCFEKAALDQAGRVAAELLERFRAPAGFYDVDAGETRRLITRPGSYQDAAAPAPNAAAARFLARLAAVTGRDEWREFAVETLGVMRDLPGRHPEAFGTLLQVAEMLETPPTEVVLSGDLDGPDGRALAGEVVRRYLPFTAVTGLRAGEAASTPLQEGRETPAGQARAFACENLACRLPTGSAAELSAQLDEMSERARIEPAGTD